MQIFRIIFGSISFCMAQEQDKLLAGDQCNRDQCMQAATLAGIPFTKSETRGAGLSTGCIVRTRTLPDHMPTSGIVPKDGKPYARFAVSWFEQAANEDMLSLEHGEGYFGCSAHHCNAKRCEKDAKSTDDGLTPTFQNSKNQLITASCDSEATKEWQLGHGCNVLYPNQFFWYNGEGKAGKREGEHECRVEIGGCSIVPAELSSKVDPSNFKSVAKVNSDGLKTKCRNIAARTKKARHACCTEQDTFVNFSNTRRTWAKAVVECGKEGNGGHLCSNKTVLATKQKRMGWTTDACTIYSEI